VRNNVQVTVYLVVSKLGYVDLNLTYTGSSIVLPALIPIFDSIIPEVKGFSVKISNYDSTFFWTAVVSEGYSTRRYELNKFNGWFGITSLAPGTTATITITATKNGHATGTVVVTGTAS
jgi:hypothetical protein